MTIGEFFKKFRSQILPGELSLLIENVLKKEKTFIIAHPEHKLSSREQEKIHAFIERRMRHEPIAYILNRKEFFGYSFLVNTSTLIPRPETEILVEKTADAISSIKEKNTIALFDIGTGSGCIPISIIQTLSHKKIFLQDTIASDISEKALRTAKRNQQRLAPHQKIAFRKSNLLEKIPKKYFQKKNWVFTANLPYLSEKIYQGAPEDVRSYEPKTALTAEEDGKKLILDLVSQIAEKRKIFQPHSCFLILEISPEQASSLKKDIPKKYLYTSLEIIPDLAGKKRFVVIR